jgi:hypothetical protein
METEKKQDKAGEEELAAYEKLRQRVSKTFGELQDRINGESISKAINKAIKPKVDGVTGGAKKQFDHWLDKGGALWHDISQETGHVYEFSRDKGVAFLANIAKGLSEWSQSLGEKLDTSLKYKTGEITHGGEFACTNCESKIHLKKPGRIPPCPKCSKTEFRRS